MRKRLLVGIPLAVSLIALLLLDGYVSPVRPLSKLEPHHAFNIWAWLSNGAICTAVVLVLTILATHELLKFARARGVSPVWGDRSGVRRHARGWAIHLV